MQLSAPIPVLKSRAKAAAAAEGVSLTQALDRLARAEGFQSWGHLSDQARKPLAARLAALLQPCDLTLVAARPGHGKTTLALGVLAQTRRGVFFTLDYTCAVAEGAYAQAGGTPGDGVRFDTSDEIDADHVIAAMEGAAPGSLAVIDYLQLLDQRRSTPPLAEQVDALAAFAKRSGTIVLCLSQVSRSFVGREGLPGLEDLRLPNPVDLSQFSRFCFLHEGQAEMR